MTPAFWRSRSRHRNPGGGDGRRPHGERSNGPADLRESNDRRPPMITAANDGVDLVGVVTKILVGESARTVVRCEQLATAAPGQPLWVSEAERVDRTSPRRVIRRDLSGWCVAKNFSRERGQ